MQGTRRRGRLEGGGLVAGSDSALVEDGAAGAVEKAAEEGVGAAEVGAWSLRRRHHQDISSAGQNIERAGQWRGGRRL